MSVIFKKSGFYTVSPDQKLESLEPDLGIVTHFRDDLEISTEDPPTLGDLVTWFRTLGEDLLFIEMYTGTDVRPYLNALGSPMTDSETEPLKSISVGTHVEIDDYNGSLQGDHEFGLSHRCSGITAGGEHQAIEFTAWEKMLSVPLTLDTQVYEQKTSWTPGDGSRARIEGNRWHSAGRVPTSVSTVYRSSGVTLGDWLQAVLSEICWFPDPVTRDREFETLLSTVKGIEDGSLKTVPVFDDADPENLEFNDIGDDDDLLN